MLNECAVITRGTGLKESRRATWARLVINDIGMIPFLELQDLTHFWEHADPPLLSRSQNVIGEEPRREAAELKHANARWIREGDTIAVRIRAVMGSAVPAREQLPCERHRRPAPDCLDPASHPR